MRTIYIIVCFLATAFAVQGQSVKANLTPGFDAQKFLTFRVDKGDLVVVAEQRADEKRFYENIKSAVQHELEGKGYKMVEDSAQLVITYVAEAIVKMDVENLGPLGQQPASDPSQVNASRSWSREYNQGSLALTMTDMATKKTVWTATSTIAVASINDQQALRTIIYRAFKKFPKRK